MREFKSKVLKTVAASPSVRATIPEAVAAILGAEPGDTLIWVPDPEERSAMVRVSKAAKPKRSKGA